MKRINILSLIGILSIALISCSKERKEINDFNPNQFSDSDPTLMITGAQMANVLFNEGEAARLAGIFSGHFTGADRQYISYQNYSIVAGDFDNIWGTVYAEGIDQRKSTRREQYGITFCSCYYRGSSFTYGFWFVGGYTQFRSM